MHAQRVSWIVMGLAVLLALPMTDARAQEDDDAPKEEADAGSVQLEAIGGLAAVNAQHTYLLIGVVSDAHVDGVYKAKQVRSVMNGVISKLGALRGMLKKLREADLSDEDGEFVDGIDEIYGLLLKEAQALSKYADTKGDAEAKAFEKSRIAALKAIDKLMGADAADEGANGKPAKPKPAKPDDAEDEDAGPDRR